MIISVNLISLLNGTINIHSIISESVQNAIMFLYRGEEPGNRKSTDKFNFPVRTLQLFEWYPGEDPAKKGGELPPACG